MLYKFIIIMINILHNYKSPKFDDRPFPMQFLILHYTEMTFEGAVERLCDPEIKVSAHYIIKENGEIYSLVDDDKRAWHSGKSAWYDFERLNDYSIGIEIDNLGNKIFEEVQINSCIELCKYLCNKYSIPTKTNIIGHSDINPEGKIDPGIYFPWEKLAKENLGIFPKRELILKPEIVAHFGDEKEIIKEIKVKLKSLGYKIENINEHFDLELNYVTRAFLSKFYPEVIFKEGGIEFFKNLSNFYYWDLNAYNILNKL